MEKNAAKEIEDRIRSSLLSLPIIDWIERSILQESFHSICNLFDLSSEAFMNTSFLDLSAHIAAPKADAIYHTLERLEQLRLPPPHTRESSPASVTLESLFEYVEDTLNFADRVLHQSRAKG